MFSRMYFEFLYQLVSLILAAILVHAVYVSIIRPTANAELQEQMVQINSNPDYVPERSVYIVVRDLEQEACFILMLWAMSLMGYKAWRSSRERQILRLDLMSVGEGISILPEDAREYSRPIQALPEATRELLLPRALLAALQRFASTGNIQDVSGAIRAVCESESERLESELSMVRYIAWAIPSIGFLGTVRGIGQALGQAHQAVQGDISGVTQSLGVAFNSTFVALLISILIMFLLHQLQLAQERSVLDAENYCDHQLVRNLKS